MEPKPLFTVNKSQRKRKEDSEKAASRSAMNITPRKTAAYTWNPTPEDIPAPFTEEELKYLEALKNGIKKPAKPAKVPRETEEDKIARAYAKLESNSFFFS